MSRLFLISAILLFSFQLGAKTPTGIRHNNLSFIENNGQIRDQAGNARNDVQYELKGNGITVFIGNGQLHYQFSKTMPGNEAEKTSLPLAANKLGETMPVSHIDITSYRMDVALEGANNNAIAEAGDMQQYYERYYLPGCPESGIIAHTFGKITYKDIYPSIDWVIYIKNGHLEYEFVVGAGGDASMIKLKYAGQTAMKINAKGSITATTPMGSITEQPPICYTSAGQLLPSAYKLAGNEVSYDMAQKSGLVIDPIVEWGTFYGTDSVSTDFYSSVCDHSGNIFSCGLTYSTSSVATTGGFQTTIGGGSDAFLVKFDSTGSPVWGTYYGGLGGDWGVGVAVDPQGNVYMTGITQGSLTNIATPGSQQPTFGGSQDAFLVKFTTDGMRKWGTYIGGTGPEVAASVACDILGHVYAGGLTTSPNNISTPGSFLPVSAGGYESYLIQYDTAGVRHWGTYYGGSGDEFGGCVCSDGISVYITGFTSSTSGMSTPGCYRPVLEGSTDAFVARFNSAGIRLWGSYYGGEGGETNGAITCSSDGNIFLFTTTTSDTGIASAGCFQPTRGGGQDIMLMKLDPEMGYRVWGTYYGGVQDEGAGHTGVVTDDSGNVYIGGFTASTTAITSAGAWQTGYGGGTNDGFFAKFRSDGLEEWSTYYGGSGDDAVNGCAYDGKNEYIAGTTSSANNIATSGSFLTTGSTGPFYYFGFIAKFEDTSLHISLQVVGAQESPANFNIYPVPNNGSFTLSGNGLTTDGQVQITVADIAGRAIINDEAVVNNGHLNKQISLGENTPAGCYILKIISPQYEQVLKFVKQ